MMRLGFKRGEKGFTLIEIIIVLAVLGILAAIVVPNVSGFTNVGKSRAWTADRSILQAAVDSYRTDISKRSGNKWPTLGQKVEPRTTTLLGAPTLTPGVAPSYTLSVSSNTTQTALLGIIDIGELATDGYLVSADSVKSANTGINTSANNTPSGSYVWYIDTDGAVHAKSYNSSTTAFVTDFQAGVFP